MVRKSEISRLRANNSDGLGEWNKRVNSLIDGIHSDLTGEKFKKSPSIIEKLKIMKAVTEAARSDFNDIAVKSDFSSISEFGDVVRRKWANV